MSLFLATAMHSRALQNSEGQAMHFLNLFQSAQLPLCLHLHCNVCNLHPDLPGVINIVEQLEGAAQPGWQGAPAHKFRAHSIEVSTHLSSLSV